MTFAFAAILFGILLVYGGVKGLSIRRLLVGDNTVAAANKTLAPATPSAGSASSGSSSGAAQAGLNASGTSLIAPNTGG